MTAFTRTALLLLAGLLLPAGIAVPAHAASGGAKKAEESRIEVEDDQVYLGDASTARKPAEVDADRVFAAIPEYRTILEEKLAEHDARYSMLMLKATRKFKKALKAAAKDGGYDLVAAAGSVTWKGHTVPDITDEVLEQLGGDE